MIRFIFISILFFNSLYSETVDFTTYASKTKWINLVKQRIDYEERYAQGFEEYFEKNFTFPNQAEINSLVDLDSKVEDNLSEGFNPITKNNDLNLGYGLKDKLKNIEALKKIYENNNLRTRTKVFTTKKGIKTQTKVYLIFKNDFVKFFRSLKDNTSKKNLLLKCSASPRSWQKGCICLSSNCNVAGGKGLKNHIYFFKNNVRTANNLLYYYHKDKYKTGPMIINSNILKESNYFTNYKQQLSLITNGVSLYDKNGVQYVKAPKSILRVGDN